MMKIHSPNFDRRATAYRDIDVEPRTCITLTNAVWDKSTTTERQYIPLKEFHAGTAEAATVPTPKHRSPAPMSMEAMIQFLKAQRLSLHGAHIYHLGVPAILSLASAYAAGKIARTVFFDTLTLFVQHTRRSGEERLGIKAHHLIALGISESDAAKLPLRNDRQDIWIVAGLFNGVIDMDDFTLLYGSEKKGLFLQRHFPDLAPESQPLGSPTKKWLSEDLLVGGKSRASPMFLQHVPAACAHMEKSPGRYKAINHYRLRLAAAERKGERLSVFGPFDSEEAMEQTFADIFRVIEPDYQPALHWRKDLESFNFVEAPRPPSCIIV